MNNNGLALSTTIEVEDGLGNPVSVVVRVDGDSFEVISTDPDNFPYLDFMDDIDEAVWAEIDYQRDLVLDRSFEFGRLDRTLGW